MNEWIFSIVFLTDIPQEFESRFKVVRALVGSVHSVTWIRSYVVHSKWRDCPKDNRMLVPGTKRLCRVGLAAVLVTALCALAFVDLPLQLLERLTEPPPTLGKSDPSYQVFPPPPSPLFPFLNWTRENLFTVFLSKKI